jgi:probable rRNA maturation factor
VSARRERASVAVAIQRATRAPGVPSDAKLRTWTRTAAGARVGEITIRIVDAAESRALNLRYRRQRKPTNVLSFPADAPPLPVREALPIGDIVICAEVVAREAAEQGKALEAHWAHLAVHGTLHLLGYDHEHASDAARMQSRESKLMKRMGFQDPWLATDWVALQDTA